MTGDIIKSFLVGLGFDVDDTSLAKFNKAIQSATLRVTALYATIKVAAAGILFGISKISEGFEQIGYEYRIISPMINKTLVLRRELLKAYAAAGINITRVVQQSVKLNMSLTKTKFAFEAIYKSVASKFFPLITKQSDIFRGKIYANMPKILDALEKFVKFVFKAFEATTALGLRVWSILSRVYDFFVMLDKATEGWSTIVLGLIAAWKLLNLSFLATPLGMLLAGLLAILALYDDFKTFQEGGESFFDWTNALSSIEALKKVLYSVRDVIDSLFTIIFNLGGAFVEAFKTIISGKNDFRQFFEYLKGAGEGILELFGRVITAFKTVGGLGGALYDALGNLFGGTVPTKDSLKGVSPGQPMPQPLGTSNVANSSTNQNVKQQTTINVNGAADASATGRAVASEQTRVNFNLTRNLKGAAQ